MSEATSLPPLGSKDADGFTFVGVTTTWKERHFAVYLHSFAPRKTTWVAATLEAAQLQAELPSRSVLSMIREAVSPAKFQDIMRGVWTCESYDPNVAWCVDFLSNLDELALKDGHRHTMLVRLKTLESVFHPTPT